MALLKLIFLLSTWSFAVTATEPGITHYRRKNSSLCLNVKKPPPYKRGVWTFDGKFVADKDYIREDYAERVVFSSTNLTLCINKLTENDTGIFKVTYFVGYFSNLIEQSENHQVIVQELRNYRAPKGRKERKKSRLIFSRSQLIFLRSCKTLSGSGSVHNDIIAVMEDTHPWGIVPRPVMTVTPENHSNIAAESCNFTVNCSIQDDYLGSVCHRNGCRTSQQSFRNVNITIFIENTVVVCSGNNNVSRNNVSENIPTTCFIRTNLERKEELQKHPNILYIVIIAVAVAVVILLSVIAIKYCKAKHDQDSTSAAQLIQSGPLESQQASEPRVSTSSSEADPSYENVETREISILIHEQGISESQGVDTVYSVPRKAASCVKSDKKPDALPDENTQKTSASGCVDVNKDQSSTQTETVYSMLQMPTHLNT